MNHELEMTKIACTKTPPAGKKQVQGKPLRN